MYDTYNPALDPFFMGDEPNSLAKPNLEGFWGDRRQVEASRKYSISTRPSAQQTEKEE
jgi:hypothetical protein